MYPDSITVTYHGRENENSVQCEFVMSEIENYIYGHYPLTGYWVRFVPGDGLFDIEVIWPTPSIPFFQETIYYLDEMKTHRHLVVQLKSVYEECLHSLVPDTSIKDNLTTFIRDLEMPTRPCLHCGGSGEIEIDGDGATQSCGECFQGWMTPTEAVDYSALN